MRRECRETFPRHRLRRKPLVSDPGMHHVPHVPWFMSGSLTRCGGENVPGNLVACATRNFSYLARGPWRRIPYVQEAERCLLYVIRRDARRVNTSRGGGHHHTDNFFKNIFVNENIGISAKISLNFVPNVPIDNTAVLVGRMAWDRTCDWPWCEKKWWNNSLTHIYVPCPRWVNGKLNVTNAVRTQMVYDKSTRQA